MKYIVCRILMGSNGIPKYLPVGYVDTLNTAIQFNQNNTDNNYVALFDVANDEQINSLYLMPADKITDINAPIDNGIPFDRIYNKTSTQITLGNLVIDANSEIIMYWNYVFLRSYLTNLITYVNNNELELRYQSTTLTHDQSIRRINYLIGIISSMGITNEEDRLLWNQFVGNRTIISFRHDVINLGNIDINTALIIKQQFDFITSLLMNGQLMEAKMAIYSTTPQAPITQELLNKYMTYLDSCYVEFVL